MAYLDFPDNPIDGELFEAPNGGIYVFKDPPKIWTCVTGDPSVPCWTYIFVGENPPPDTNTCAGTLWFNSEEGNLYIYYAEPSVGGSSQFIPASKCSNQILLNLEQILDVTYPNPPVNGDILAFNGGVWEPTAPGGAFNINLSDLNDVIIAPGITPDDRDILVYDANAPIGWKNETLYTIQNNEFLLGLDTAANDIELIGIANNDVIGVGSDAYDLNIRGTVRAFTTYANDVSIAGLYSNNTTLRNLIFMSSDDKVTLGDGGNVQSVIRAETPADYPAVRLGAFGSTTDYLIIHENNKNLIILDDLGNVDLTTSPPVNTNVLFFNGVEWIASSLLLNNLSDVDTTTVIPITNDVLKFDGTNWVPDIIGIVELDGVDLTTAAPVFGDLLQFDGTNWVNTTISIDELNDVDTTTATPNVGDLLEWDGSNWIPTVRPLLTDLGEFADDTAAGVGGITIGQLYRLPGGTEFSDIRVRLT